MDSYRDCLEHARSHKYIRKERTSSGEWRYYYPDDSFGSVQRDKSNVQKSKTPHSLYKGADTNIDRPPSSIQRDKTNTQKSKSPHSLYKETDTHVDRLSQLVQREKPDFKRVKLWIKRLLPKVTRSKKKIEKGKKAIYKRLAR